MSHQLDAVRSLAATLRHNPGSMRTGGIEDQLTWLSALAYYARHLAKNTDEIPSPYDSSPRWREMDAATRENYQSMLAALDDRPPTHIHDPTGTPIPVNADTTHTDSPALVDLMRINQTLLAFMTAIRPDSAPDHGGGRRLTRTAEPPRH